MFPRAGRARHRRAAVALAASDLGGTITRAG
jgi:hypothetical protein